MDEIDALNASFAQTDGARRIVVERDVLGGPAVRLEAGGGKALVSLWGGQVLSWQPAGHEEVLWLSPLARLDTGKPVRGGIPICWPWFGPSKVDPKWPSHGVARTMMWSVASGDWGGDAGDDFVELSLVCETTDADANPIPAKDGGPSVPVAATLDLTLRLDHRLSLAIATRNIGSAPLDLTQALHTYLRVGDVARAAVDGLEALEFVDQVDGGSRKLQAGRTTITGEVDRIYDAHTGEAVVDDPVLGRRIRIAKSGSRSTVVWNPAAAKAARLGDVPGDEWTRMLCVETANAGRDIVRLQPGDRHVLQMVVAVERY